MSNLLSTTLLLKKVLMTVHRIKWKLVDWTSRPFTVWSQYTYLSFLLSTCFISRNLLSQPGSFAYLFTVTHNTLLFTLLPNALQLVTCPRSLPWFKAQGKRSIFSLRKFSLSLETSHLILNPCGIYGTWNLVSYFVS